MLQNLCMFIFLLSFKLSKQSEVTSSTLQALNYCLRLNNCTTKNNGKCVKLTCSNDNSCLSPTDVDAYTTTEIELLQSEKCVSNRQLVSLFMKHEFTSVIVIGNITIDFLKLTNENLTRLSLTGNFNAQTTSIHLNRTFFDSVKYLKSLEFIGMGIGSIEMRTFKVLTSLVNLDLSYNRLKSLTTLSFYGLGNLKHLNLTANQIDSIEASSFNDVQSLMSLDLRANFIQHISKSTFSGLTSVTYLDLSRNNLKSLNDSIFFGLINLKTLYLQSNTILTIHANAFKGLRSVELIDLSQNLLKHIDKSFLQFSKNLRELYLNEQIGDFHLNDFMFYELKSSNIQIHMSGSSNKLIDSQHYPFCIKNISLLSNIMLHFENTAFEPCLFYNFIGLENKTLTLRNSKLECNCVFTALRKAYVVLDGTCSYGHGRVRKLTEIDCLDECTHWYNYVCSKETSPDEYYNDELINIEENQGLRMEINLFIQISSFVFYGFQKV